MRLYHWTLGDRATAILAEGFRDSGYDSEPPLERGVWFSEDDGGWRSGNEALLAVDIPDEQVRPEWQSKLTPGEWQIPSQYLREAAVHPIRVL